MARVCSLSQLDRTNGDEFALASTNSPLDIFLSGNPRTNLPPTPTKTPRQIHDFRKEPAFSALSGLRPGPYFAQLSPGLLVSIHKAYRVYPDPAGAFSYGVLQMEEEQAEKDGDEGPWFQVLSSTSPLTRGGATVAVPSRLYYPPASAEKPLSGVRVGVKDLYDLRGLKTSGGSRAWFDLYPAATATAASIRHLLDLGAVVVGKTRTSQFGNGEAPTADWVDGPAPFNARGEGYQDASSSSAGAGSAQSSYAWVDMNVGSDTGGSVRAPAAVAGVFGNRPSQHLMSMRGALPMSSHMDTPAFMARSAADFAAWGRAWYAAGNASLRDDYPAFPPTLLYAVDTPGINLTRFPSPGFFPSPNDEAQSMYDDFAAGLERLLGAGSSRVELDFYSAYKTSSGTGLYPVEQLGSVWNLMTSYEQSRGVFAQLSRDWAAAHGGDSPYFDPRVALSYEYGRNLSQAQFDEALANKTVFKTWLEAELLAPRHDTPHCSSALLIHPVWSGEPVYRDEYPAESPEEAGTWFGWNKYGIAQLGGVPEVVLPIGQVNYTSRISGTRKWLPVAVSINAAAGCDLMLFRLVEKLAEAGIIPTEVITGPTLGI